MAGAPGHLIGQIIGFALEEALLPVLESVASENDLFLDSAGPRPGVRTGRKVAWRDTLENTHDLDFVFERGGSMSIRGNPAAFVEAAWRRYKKHSKAKAQEMQGALLPLLAAWADVKPIAAAVVAGEWTSPALLQLRSSGFEVLHLDFPTTIAAFEDFGIDIVGEGEGTADTFWQSQIDIYSALGGEGKSALAAHLRTLHREEFDEFAESLQRRMVRTVEYVTVIALYGSEVRYERASQAIEGVRHNLLDVDTGPFVRYDIRVAYTNGDDIRASFGSAHDAVAFLETFG